MKNLKLFALFIVFLLVAGCASIGPKIIVETPEPAEDFVVLCDKSVDYLIGHNADSYSTVDKVFVVKSGEEVDCGIILGGDAFGASVLHPIYVGDGKENYEKDGVQHIVMNKTKLDLLDEQKAKFEAGYWDKTRNPAWEYLGSRPGCGFPHQYFEYYKQAKRVNVEHFKNKYQKAILECLNKSNIDTKKYDPYLANKLPEPSIRVKQLWESLKENVSDE